MAVGARVHAIAPLPAAAGGALAAAALAPAGIIPAAPLALFLLFYLALNAAPRRAFAIGWAFGLAYFLIGLWWVHAALSGHIGLPWAAALLLTLLFCMALALFPAGALALAAKCAPPGGMARLLALAACWTLMEWLRSWALTGFPWLMMGYGQIPHGPFAAWAPLAGMLGVTAALALAVAAVLGGILLPRRRLTFTLILLCAIGIAPLANHLHQWVTPVGTLQVSLLQGNVKQSLKWEPEVVRQALKDYLRLAAAAQGQVVILPETALPVPLDRLPDGYVDILRDIAIARGGAVIAGVFSEEEGKIYNAAIALHEGETQLYRKVHLTPYGEYLPFADILAPLLGAAGVPYSSLSAGSEAQPLHLPLSGGILAAMSICYEDIFGNEWRRQLPQASFLVNITNDAWFDNTHMPAQHLQMAQARALETGRWLVRATNTGISAVVDSEGRIAAQLPPQTQDILEAEITLYEGATPYVQWGDALAAALAALLLAVVAGWRFTFFASSSCVMPTSRKAR